MKRKFSWRVFISIALLYSFVIIFLTGIVLYLAPAGRVSNWVNWKLLGFSKENWQAIHTIFSLLFVILSIFHLFVINWRTFWAYLKSKTSNGLNKKKEFYISTVATILIFIGVIFSVPPFSSIMEFGDYLTESWDTQNSNPPIPHAELLTLNELAKQLDNIPVEKLTKKLEDNKIKFNSTTETLSEIGVINNISPAEIYNLISKKSTTNMTGMGIGRKTLEEYAKENDMDIDKVIKLLLDNNIKAQKNQTLKTIASENDMAPMDVDALIKKML